MRMGMNGPTPSSMIRWFSPEKKKTRIMSLSFRCVTQELNSNLIDA